MKYYNVKACAFLFLITTITTGIILNTTNDGFTGFSVAKDCEIECYLNSDCPTNYQCMEGGTCNATCEEFK